MSISVAHSPAAPAPVVFAAGELARYLAKMLPPDFQSHFTLEATGDAHRDRYTVQLTPQGGRLTGDNPRSVLLGVYAALHALGCRFLGPGADWEVVPTLSALPQLSFTRAAAFPHRGVCIEGADSLENVLDFVDWLPKVGYNTFFLQFKNPYAFLKRWYHHENNPLLPPQPFTPADASAAMAEIEAQMKRRGLLLHKAGHGWTGEVLGYDALGWDASPAPLSADKRPLCAQVNGVRALWQGIPADTNLCLSNPRAVEELVDRVADYAQANPEVDYLHIWLADEYNNLCECPQCQATTLSDQYVEVLNRMDARLTQLGLDTKLVFLLYQELLWPPIQARLAHPERFLLLFAPISRTFQRSYDLTGQDAPLPPYVRNRVTLPTALGENLAFLRGWQAIFSGEGFVYDYPLGRAHYGDLGYVHMARVIWEDVHKLPALGLEGYLSCQELRAGCPNFFPNYVLGQALFGGKTTFEEWAETYFQAAYGPDWRRVYRYLSALSDHNCCDYLNGKGPRTDPAVARRLAEALALCRDFEPAGDGPRWAILAYHRGYALRLLAALASLARGEDAGAESRAMADYIRRGETRFQSALDVYRVLEVTHKYTGFPDLNQGGFLMRHDYYSYDRAQLLKDAKLPLEVYPDKPAVFQAIAREMVEEIQKKNALGKTTVFICPVGPIGQYPYFVDLVNQQRVSLKKVWFLNMDEYLTDDKEWIPTDHPLSFRGFMDRTVYTKIDQELLMPPEQRVFPDPHDPEKLDRLIEELGGVDVCFGGIGINGHLAFNEAQPELTAEEFAALGTRVLAVSPETRAANAIGDFGGALEDMPHWCVTIGIRQILASRKVRLGVFRDWHRAVARRAAHGERTAAFPVSLLHTHPDVVLRMTEFVANLDG